MTFGALTGWARVHTPSASRPAIAAAFGPNADMYTGIRRGGRSYSRASRARKYRPS